MANPSISRSAIMAALFARLNAISSFTTKSRKYRDVKDVGGAEQPALFLLAADKQNATYSQAAGARPIWDLEPDLLVYAQTPVAADPLSPDEVLEPLIDAIDAALLWAPGDGPPAMGSPTGLGGLVTHCRISGIEIGEGAKSGQAVVLIHLHILAAGM